jgi:uncharacterized protein
MQEWQQADRLLAALLETMKRMEPLAVAVSGGVDSMTLATAAHRSTGVRCSIYHAVSPAVPVAATRRVRDLAEAEGWRLRIIDAGEFSEPKYRSNPVNRCYFCKKNLYGMIARMTHDQIVSGTNMDDLGDYRPGLDAASEHDVRHPFVEAGISKVQIRMLARALGLREIAVLPAAPCLSSRVETRIPIEPGVLRAIDQAERMVAATISVATVRCRVRATGVVLELDANSLANLSESLKRELGTAVVQIFAAAGRPASVSFSDYRMGSAFLRGSGENA